MEHEQEEKVITFFDSIAFNYKKRYKTVNPFYSYFFNQRLERAVQNFDFNNQRILDIGAGTGSLYDYIKENFSGYNYYAIDVSGEMLKESNIPKEKQFIGRTNDIKLPEQSFNYIYLLGVTTYMSKEEWLQHIEYIYKNLEKGGRCVVSFSNKTSLNTIQIKIFKKVIRLFFSKAKKVISQDIKLNFYTKKEAEEIIKEKFEIENLFYLNQAPIILSNTLPRFSVFVAKLTEKFFSGSPRLLSLFSSDFMFTLRKK